MSVDLKTLAEVVGVPEDLVRCRNCGSARHWVGDAYLCTLWHESRVKGYDFCSFWSDRDRGDMDVHD